jgi:hypothetical protein
MMNALMTVGFGGLGLTFGAVFTVLIFSLAALPVRIWQGYVASTLAGWFLVPYGVPAIGVLGWTGIVTLAFLLSYHPDLRKRAPSETIGFTEALGHGIGMPLGVLFIGWVIQHWV